MEFLCVIEWSKIQKKNEMQIFLTFHYFGGAVDKVLAVGGEVAAEPAGTSFFEGLEEEVGLVFQAELVADSQLIEGEEVRVEVGIVVVQGGFNLFGDRVGEGYATGVFF